MKRIKPADGVMIIKIFRTIPRGLYNMAPLQQINFFLLYISNIVTISSNTDC